MRSVQWVNNPLGRRDSNPWHHRTTRTGKNWDWTGDDDDGTHDDDDDDDGALDDGGGDDDGTDLMFVIFSPQMYFWAQFFSTWKLHKFWMYGDVL